jgi:hypothetical protein
MGLSLRVLLSAVLLSGLVLVTPAEANPSCVTYLVTGPVVGTVEGTRCVPLPDAFNFPVSLSNCRGLPGLGTTICVGVDLNIWRP